MMNLIHVYSAGMMMQLHWAFKCARIYEMFEVRRLAAICAGDPNKY